MLLVTIASVAIAWDLRRLDANFNRLYFLLRTARLDAFYKHATFIVRFNSDTVTVTNQKYSKNIKTVIPMIAKVDYDTTIGNSMIVYTWRGTTSDFNKRIHGGDIILKSVLGFKRYIHVNCNGVVAEGRYPEDG